MTEENLEPKIAAKEGKIARYTKPLSPKVASFYSSLPDPSSHQLGKALIFQLPGASG